jgi:transposase
VTASGLAPLSVPEMRRLVHAGQATPARQRHLLAWSHFRRQHQCGAGRGHAERRARERVLVGPAPIADPAAPGPALQLASTAALTEATWAEIAPLVPRLQVAPKRTRYDHRTVLEGILAQMRSGRSWRDSPRTDVPWPILYQRYNLWHRRGLWDVILHILHPDDDLPFIT